MHGHLLFPQFLTFLLIKVLRKLSLPYARSQPAEEPNKKHQVVHASPHLWQNLGVMSTLQATQKNDAPCQALPHISTSPRKFLLIASYSRLMFQGIGLMGVGVDQVYTKLCSHWKRGERNVLCRRKGSQTMNCHLTCSSWVHCGPHGAVGHCAAHGAFLEEQTPGSFFMALGGTGWLEKYDPDVPSQRSKELVPSHARRQDKVFHGENMSRGEIANDGSQT